MNFEVENMKSAKTIELWEELKEVFLSKNNFIDFLLPPLVFVVSNSLIGIVWGIAISIAMTVILIAIRAIRKASISNALAGIAGIGISAAVAYFIGDSKGYFLSDILQGYGLAIISLISIFVGWPTVAITSKIVRRWPSEWYKHPRVSPAYTEVTFFWTVFFALQASVQLYVLNNQDIAIYTMLNLITGWPGTITLLITSYLYGIWRLQKLGGPSVNEFKSNAEPPWKGQERGF